MSLDAISNNVGVSSLDGPEVDTRSAARDHSKPTKRYEENAVSNFIGGPGQSDGPVPDQAFDLFKAIGDLFSGNQQPQGNGKDAANKFDLGALLLAIFDFAGKQAEKPAAPPSKDAHQDVAGKQAEKSAAPPSRDANQVKAQERVEVSGRGGDEHVRTQGRAAAEAHAGASTFSEAFVEGSEVGVRAGAEASAGVSAEAEGSITTDVGSIDGRARVSAEVYARLYGEARAGPTGASATGRAEVGVMAKGDAEVNMQIADGLVAGHADARAEAGAGGKAIGRVGISYDPAEVVVNAKAETFAGARAGFSAKGGVAGVGYGIECEVWAGVGAKAEINGGLDKDGKFKIEFSLGISVGVGFMVKFSLEIDTKVLAKVAADIIGVLGGVFGAIFGAVAALFDGGSGDGKRAGKAISDAIRQVAPAVGQIAAEAAKKELDAETAEPSESSSDHDTESDHGSSTKRDPNVRTSETHGTLLEGSLS